jgi:hypothetical protein
MSTTIMEAQDGIDALRKEIEDLRRQVAALAAAQPLSDKNQAHHEAKHDTAAPEELVLVIAAAIAAYLGKKATIKFIRRVETDAPSWQTYGRASIAGSHALPKVRGW